MGPRHAVQLWRELRPTRSHERFMMSSAQVTNQNKAPKLSSNSWSWITRNPLVDLLLLAIRPTLVASDSATVAWIKRHPLLTLVGLAYGLTWIGLIPLLRNPHLPLDPSHVSLSSILVAFLGVLGCLWAAVIVAAATGGAAGRRALLLGYLKWKVGPQWYLVILLGPTAVWLAAMGLDRLLTGTLPAIPAFTYLPGALLGAYVIFLGQYLIGNYEEICWRASLMPRLQSKYSALTASLIVGVIQGLWHLPYAFVPGHFVQTIGLPAMVLLSMAMSVVFGWVYINTRGSLLMVALFHAAFDAWSPFQGSDATLAYLMIGVWCLVAVVVVVIFGPQRFSRKPAAETADIIL
jgi:membrane protease YdiL (CAAX protease family)